MTVVLRAATGTWINESIGCLGASELNAAANFTKAGKPGADYQRLLRCKVAERLTGIKMGTPPTAAMQRGIDNQAPATRLYAARRGVLVGPEAMVKHPTIEHFKATPDIWIDPDGLGEVKSPLIETYTEWIAAGEIPEQHRLQLVGQIACSGRKWVDFIAYCPEMPKGRELFVRRFEPTRDEIEEVETIARKFLADVDQMFDAVSCMEMIR